MGAIVYLRGSVQHTIGSNGKLLFELLQKARSQSQIGDTQDFWVVGYNFAQASWEAQIVCNDHGGVKGLEV